MPGPVQQVIFKPEAPAVSVGLEPAHNAIYSLFTLLQADELSGLGDWVTRTAAELSPKERETHGLVIIGFYFAVIPQQSWPSFPAYLDSLASRDPIALRDKMLKVYASISPAQLRGQEEPASYEPEQEDWEAVLESVDTYLDFLRRHFGDDKVDVALESRAYKYVANPPAMQQLIVTHLRHMWEKYLAAEWERVVPMLQDAVKAFQQLDLHDKSRKEIGELITGQSAEDAKWAKALDEPERVLFVPNAHIGPYVGRLCGDPTAWILFGARLPEGASLDAPDLSRNEIVVRLSALADDNRLRILKMIAEAGELRSAEIMERLDLSQSAASRHLKQLSATGYLSERRCNGAKCYKLDPERLEGILQSVSAFLLGR
jgi:DNA-binding transcriptional ArsR family regulator